MSICRALSGKFSFVAAWSPGLPRAGLVWFKTLESRDVDSDDGSGSLESLFLLLSQLGTFIQESLQWLAEWMRSPWCIWNSGTHLSILDPGMCKPAAWEGTDSFPWLRFIWCLISITLQSHSPTWSSCWYLSPLLHTSSMVVAVPERRKGWCGGQVYKNIRGKLWVGLKNHCKILPAPLCPAVLQKSHFSKTNSKSN